MRNKTPVTLLAGISSVLLIGAALVFGLGVSGGLDERTSPFVTLILGIIGTTIPSLLALYKSEATQNDIKNGVLVNKVKQALEESAVVVSQPPPPGDALPENYVGGTPAPNSPTTTP